MRFWIFALCCAMLAGQAWAADAGKETTPAAEQQAAPEYNTITLQGLNKVTGHISKLEGVVGTVLRFDNLEIIPRRCWKSTPEERPENAALLEISELRSGETPRRIFLGWMFSSSPGLSGLEHAVYDINVLSCGTSKASDAPEEEKTKPRKAEPPKKKS